VIFKQPLEYQGYRFWINDIKYYKYFLKLWANKNRLSLETSDSILSYIRYFYDFFYDCYYYYKFARIHLLERLDRFFYEFRENINSKTFWQYTALEIIRRTI